MTGGTEREIRGRTTRTKGSPGQVVDRAGDSGLCRAWVGAVVKLRPRVFQHDETTCVLRFQQGKGGRSRYYPGTEEAHTNPTRQRGECLRALAGASG